MSETKLNDGLERFCSGDPFAYAMQGVDEIPGSTKHSEGSLAAAIQSIYGTEVSTDTGSVLDRLNSANDPQELVNAVKNAGLNEVTDWPDTFDSDDLHEEVDDVDDPGLGEAMRLIDTKLSDSLCPRDKDANKMTSKRERKHVYVPEVVNKAGENGTVYMAKTMSSSAKVRMAWDIHDSNQVVVVDDYEKWESLLGWKKLKSLPHGKNKIREELGGVLSDEVLDIVAGEQAGDTDTQDDSASDTSSRGRRTRTKPSEEVLNLARGSRHRQRTKMKSKDIAETFDDDESIGYNNIEMLVLFPSTTDLNMTDHWWIPGTRWPGAGSVAIANCNKGTFEYLNQYEQVWHIEDYLEQATDYEFKTNAGPLTMNVASTQTLVMHAVSEQTQERLMRDGIIENIPPALVEYVEEEMYRGPELPHPDDMVYAPITQEDAFWMRPELRKQHSPEEGDAVVCYADVTLRDLGNTYSVSSDYRLYSRARLPNWDFDALELSQLDSASHYMKLDKGGYEMLETLGKLHDAGEQPFSETPESRWQ
jgi:hypothetical protein